jgi:putative nucleotidyltransferase with HDIG domain
VVGVEVSGEIAGEPGGLHNWLLSVYPVFIGNEITGLGIVTVDITEHTRAERVQRALTHAVVDAIAATTEARDPYTAGHQSRVAALASRIAADIGVNTQSIEGIDLAARIHDIGKMAIPSEILTKFTPLNNPEWELIKTHSKIGADIVRGIDFPWPIADMIEQHHERLDGSGYPDGLHGAEILIEARVIAVADVVEAMASHRPYRPARGVAVALEEIEQKRGTLFDPQAVDACLRLFRECHYSLDYPGESALRSAALADRTPSARV